MNKELTSILETEIDYVQQKLDDLKEALQNYKDAISLTMSDTDIFEKVDKKIKEHELQLIKMRKRNGIKEKV